MSVTRDINPEHRLLAGPRHVRFWRAGVGSGGRKRIAQHRAPVVFRRGMLGSVSKKVNLGGPASGPLSLPRSPENRAAQRSKAARTAALTKQRATCTRTMTKEMACTHTPDNCQNVVLETDHPKVCKS